MFNFGKNSNRDLSVPTEVKTDSQAREVMRVWVAHGGLVCALRPESWPDSSSWGIVLADVARHVANAVHELNGEEPAITVEKIRTLFVAELTTPTDEPTGHF